MKIIYSRTIYIIYIQIHIDIRMLQPTFTTISTNVYVEGASLRIWRAIQIYNCVRIHDPSERIRGPSRLRLFYRTIHPINLVNANSSRVPFHNLARNRVYLLYLHMPRSQCTNVRVKVMDSTQARNEETWVLLDNDTRLDMCSRGKIGIKYIYMYTHNAQVLCKCGMKDSFSNEPTGGQFMGNRETIFVFYYTQIIYFEYIYPDSF